jgi:transposase
MTKSILGIDIAKHKFDCCFLLEDGSKNCCSFSNDALGFALLQKKIEQLKITQLHAALEATGRYGDALARFLHAQEHGVSIINPVCTKNYAKAKLLRNKNDRVDSALIAQFVKETNPPLWTPPSHSQSHLQELTRHLLSRKRELTKERNRLGNPRQNKAVCKDIKSSIKHLEKSIQSLEKAITELIEADPALLVNMKLLCSIDGIGPTTAAIILAELPPVDQFKSCSQAVAYAGLSPRQFCSGSSIQAKTRLCKTGNRYLRQALYFPAVVGLTHNPVLRAKAQRMEAAGKSKMCIVGALMHKLLRIAFGVLKHQSPFAPEWKAQNPKENIPTP